MEPLELIEKYASKGALVDTNLLLVIAIGTYSRSRLTTFKRTAAYTEEDFELVVGLFDKFRKRVTTPNIVTEVDNLGRQLPKAEHGRFSQVLRFLVENSLETYLPSARLAQNSRYAALGMTDCAILEASEDVLVLTDDFRLSSILARLDRDALNINHIRPLV